MPETAVAGEECRKRFLGLRKAVARPSECPHKVVESADSLKLLSDFNLNSNVSIASMLKFGI
ncbi:MAG: hypothetical protein DMF24_06805 [Verrucomicrobia bacterium]|nr:MAG: hypothetical protein DME90_03000 [Verrucomicrobiota bacterium]PYL61561.1 MAG: hypothetical protein DMF24_06805 [Verrucomicrobiota bacterium]